MFGSAVTTSASSSSSIRRRRTESRRALRAAVGACGMDGGEKVFERGGGADGAVAFGIWGNGFQGDERFWPRRGFNLPRQPGDRLFQVGIVRGERQRGFVLGQRRGQVAATLMDFRQAADGGEVLGRAAEHGLQFLPGAIEVAEFDQRPAKRHARREVSGVDPQARAADLHRLRMLTGAAVFLGQLCKSNRSRILLDAASQVVDTRVVGHVELKGLSTRFPVDYPTIISWVVLARTPRSSVTV